MGWKRVKDWIEENKIVLTIISTIVGVLGFGILVYQTWIQSPTPRPVYIIPTPTPNAPIQITKPAEGAGGWGPNLLVKFLVTTEGIGGYTKEIDALEGEEVHFYIEIENTNHPSDAKNLTVKVNLPATQAGGVITPIATASTTSPTTVAGSKTTVTDSIQIINLPADALLQYESGSLRITGDLNGDGNKEYDNSSWPNDNITTNGINLGTLTSNHPSYLQLSFTAKVLAGTDPNLTVKHLWAIGKRSADGWNDNTNANPGDLLQFYIEVHNTNVPSVAKDLVVRVDLLNGEGETFNSLVTADASNATFVTDATKVTFSTKTKWHVRPKSTRIAWDANGDGTLDYNGFLWPNDKLFTSSGINLGELWGCNPYIIQISFWVDTESLTRTSLDLVAPD